MLKVVPYSPLHMGFIEVDPRFAGVASREDPDMLARSRQAWTFLDEDASVVAIVGAMETHSRCAFIWSFMSKAADQHMAAITKHVREWLPNLGCIRLEATVLKDCKASHGWMRELGFRKETSRPMKRWDGVNDFHLYSMVTRA